MYYGLSTSKFCSLLTGSCKCKATFDFPHPAINVHGNNKVFSIIWVATARLQILKFKSNGHCKAVGSIQREIDGPAPTYIKLPSKANSETYARILPRRQLDFVKSEWWWCVVLQ